MPESPTELFDAKLRALLSEPRTVQRTISPTPVFAPTSSPTPNRLEPRGPVRRRARATIVRRAVAAAALAVITTLVVITRLDDTTEAHQFGAATQDPQRAQNPQNTPDPNGQDAGTATEPTTKQCNLWVRDLADPARREAAIAGLSQGNANTAAFLSDWLQGFDDASETPESTHGALRALARLGPSAIHEADALRRLLHLWPARSCVPLLHTLGTLAAWEEIRIEQHGMSARSMDLDGEDKDIPDPQTASQLYRASCRLRERANVGENRSIQGLRKHLVGSAFEREGALDVLLRTSTLSPQLVLAVEAILTEAQPAFEGAEWTDEGDLRSCKFDLQTELRDRAATLLLLRRPQSPIAATALGHRVENRLASLTERRRATLELGRLLSQKEHQIQPHLDRALTILLQAAGGDQPALAGDAITALGQIGVATAVVRETLDQLQTSSDAQLARRARAALAAIATPKPPANDRTPR